MPAPIPLLQLKPLLLEAVEGNNLQKLERLLADTKLYKDFTINFLNEDGYGLLHIAAKQNFAAIIDCLLKCEKIDINLKKYTTPIHLAIKYGSKNAAQKLLQDPRLNIDIRISESVMLYDHDDFCKNFMDNKRKIKFNNNFFNPISPKYICIDLGKTPFVCAAERSQIDIMQSLLTKIDNLKAFTDNLETAFLVAQATAADPSLNETEADKTVHANIIQLLFDNGAGIGCLIYKPRLLLLPLDTRGKIIIGTIKDFKIYDEYDCYEYSSPVRITRSVPGFENAITSVSELKEAIGDNTLSLNNKSRQLLMAMCDKHTNSDPTIKKEIQEIKQLLQEYQPKIENNNISTRKFCFV